MGFSNVSKENYNPRQAHIRKQHRNPGSKPTVGRKSPLGKLCSLHGFCNRFRVSFLLLRPYCKLCKMLSKEHRAERRTSSSKPTGAPRSPWPWVNPLASLGCPARVWNEGWPSQLLSEIPTVHKGPALVLPRQGLMGTNGKKWPNRIFVSITPNLA